MANPKRIRAAAGAQAAADAAATAKPEPVKEAPKGDDLNDPVEQQKILEPEPRIVTVGGVEVMLHPLPAKIARQFVGLVMQILGDVQMRGNLAGSIITRMSGVLIENGELTRKFAGYVARSTFATNAMPTLEQIMVEQQRIDERAEVAELVAMFTHMADMNNALGALTGKK